MFAELSAHQAELTTAVEAMGLLVVGMAFSGKLREWWLKVAGEKCQYIEYTEKRGFHTCGERANHVHHAPAEGWLLDHGEDPNQIAGVALCENHHVRNTSGDEYDPDSSMHPDMAQAYREYRQWKENNEHLRSISGNGHRKITPSPFDEALADHRRLTRSGERYWNTTPEMDDLYQERIKLLERRYLLAHPDEKRPETKPHKNYDPSKKKDWTDQVVPRKGRR